MNVLITGATRGIGRETARQLTAAGHTVLLTGRNGDDADRTALALRREPGAAAETHTLDVADPASCRALIDHLVTAELRVDALVNNAGIFPDLGAGFFDVTEDTIRAELEVHFFGAWRLIQTLLPGMLERGFGRVVNLSSGYGDSGPGGGMTGYRVAKGAVNTLTRVAAAEAGGNVKVNAVDPGWVATAMGGEQAPRSPTEGAADVVHAVTLAADGPNGILLRHRRPAAW